MRLGRFLWQRRQLSSITRRQQGSVDVEKFKVGYFAEKVPVILEQEFRHLKALEKWPSREWTYLRKWSDVLVPVEIYSSESTNYASANEKGSFEKVEMPFGIFLGAFMSDSPGHGYHGYLAQAPLLELIPELSPDVQADGRPPALTKVGRGDIYAVNVWMGRKSLTPIHRDPHHNLFVQLFGRKKIRIYPDTCNPEDLYISSDPLHRNTSMISNVWDPKEYESSPRLQQADGQALEGELGPGDAVYVPQGYWHTVASVESANAPSSVAASVNWWFR